MPRKLTPMQADALVRMQGLPSPCITDDLRRALRVPMQTARNVLDQLMLKGLVRRGPKRVQESVCMGKRRRLHICTWYLV